MAVNNVQVSDTVRELVTLLMKRPITEDIAMQVATYDTFKNLEIVNGDWTGFERDEYVTGEEHGWIETKILFFLTGFVLENNLGRVYPGDMDFVLSGDRDNLRDKRQPDVAFVKKERLQKTPGYFYGAPDLAIEIVSPSQSRPEFIEKASVYLKYGTEQVWLVFPKKQQIEVHTAETIPNVYDKTEIVPGGDLLPGFELRVSQLFDT